MFSYKHFFRCIPSILVYCVTFSLFKYFLTYLFKPFGIFKSSSVQSLSLTDYLWPNRLQHARLPCPSPTPRVYSNSCPLSWWCHPTISSSAIPFSSHLQSFPASGSFQMSQFFTSGGKLLEFQLQHQSFQWIFRTDLLYNGITQMSTISTTVGKNPLEEME